jgi:hypothetical protein
VSAIDITQFVRMQEVLQRRLTSQGFDLMQSFEVGRYNRAVDADFRLPTFGNPRNVGILVGNTKALWPAFFRAYQDNTSLRSNPNPLDSYTETSFREALAGVDLPYEIRFGHSATPSPVAMQTLAHISGLAHLSPSHLNIHPDHGPWIALRAAIVWNWQEELTEPSLKDPCQGQCKHVCIPLFDAALTAMDKDHTHQQMLTNWQAWLKVREACPVGRDSRYCEAQIRYHYIHDRSGLDA